MNLMKKKLLAARTLRVGKERIVFSQSRLNDIKESITKEDIRTLHKEGAILIKEISGRKKGKEKKGKRIVKKKVNKRKQEYVKITRKLRKYLMEIKSKGKLSNEEIKDIRKKIRNRFFPSKASLREHINSLIGGKKKWRPLKEEEEKVKPIMEKE